MPHKCIIEIKEGIFGNTNSWVSRIKNRYLQCITVSAGNPLSAFYLRSEKSIKMEKIRQLNSKHPYIIHPLSKFRLVYDIYSFVLYLTFLIVKPIDGSIWRTQAMRDIFIYYQEFSFCLDILSWIDIMVHFSSGYIDSDKHIEIAPRNIARHYVFNGFFIFDLLSSIPKYLLTLINDIHGLRPIVGAQIVCCNLKFVRILTVVQLVSKISLYFSVKSKTLVFLISSVILFFLVMHHSTCLLIMVPRLVRFFFCPPESLRKAIPWIKLSKTLPYGELYIINMFKSSAYLLGIRLNVDEEYFHTEDYVVVIITYVIGKVIIASTWVVLAMAILRRKSMNIRFRELMNQLDEYMKQRQLPMALRRRIRAYYQFKYNGSFFKEEMITGLLSERLRKDVNIHVCRSLIASVPLFVELTSRQVREIVAFLVPEIFLPNDVIVQSGSPGDAMYFLASGTVAVYTHSGKEVCHLQDGSYFGEISLVLKNQTRTTTIIAIEISQVYRLNKRDFQKCIGKNKHRGSTDMNKARTESFDIDASTLNKG
ncbi:hypothetical protein JTB14_009413 [Gonioctena quinquepunctata]|nr:hypothetical protein JTB14_009413 [Gonioctena quinquepunctata]